MNYPTNSERYQRGGSTLIGLLFGLCLGILTLIKWPHLEVPIRAMLQGSDVAALREIAVTSSSVGLATHTERLPDITGSKVVSVLAQASSVVDSTSYGLNEPQLTPLDLDHLSPSEALAESHQHSAGAAPVLWHPVWPAFSSETAAASFARVVSSAIGFDIEVQSMPDGRSVPVVECANSAECSSYEFQVAQLLARSNSEENSL